jgi:hypothetical protein
VDNNFLRAADGFSRRAFLAGAAGAAASSLFPIKAVAAPAAAADFPLATIHAPMVRALRESPLIGHLARDWSGEVDELRELYAAGSEDVRENLAAGVAHLSESRFASVPPGHAHRLLKKALEDPEQHAKVRMLVSVYLSRITPSCMADAPLGVTV